jgi:hypothetical protein
VTDLIRGGVFYRLMLRTGAGIASISMDIAFLFLMGDDVSGHTAGAAK